MQTATIVRASIPEAEVVQITALRRGDVYKRLVKNYSDNYTVHYGIVTDVMFNGEDAAITSIEFSRSYNAVTPTLSTFGTDSELKIFGATPEEVHQHLAELHETAQRAVEAKQKELDAAYAVRQQVFEMQALAEEQALNAAPVRIGLAPVEEPEGA